MTPVAHSPKKGYRTIRLPLAESEYDRFLTNRAYAKTRLEEFYEDVPELFPDAFPWGYAFFGFTEPSSKQQLCCRRIRLEQGCTVFTVAPAFVMPYMTGRTHDVDDALFLMRFHVPCWPLPRSSDATRCIGIDWNKDWHGSVWWGPRSNERIGYPQTWWLTKSIVG
jgi:hypothetical protein